MPGKGKGKARGESRGKGSHHGANETPERLERKLVFRVSRELLQDGGNATEIAREARRYFVETGQETEGVHVIGMWRNPDNKNPLHSNWKTSDDDGQSLEGFYRTIVQRTGMSAESPAQRERTIGVITTPTNTRSTAMKAYHKQLNEIRSKHKSWRDEKVKAEYRKQRDKKGSSRSKKAKKRGKRKK